MSRKVIYVSWIPLTEKVLRDWYIDYLISKGLTVEYWDVTYLLRGELNQISTITTNYSHSLRSLREIEQLLKHSENSDALFVMLITYDGRRAFFYRLFSKHSCRMLFIRWGAMPADSNNISLFQKLRKEIHRPLVLAEKIIFRIIGHYYRKLKFVEPYEIVFAAGQSSMENNYAGKVVPINLCDFENYKKSTLKTERLVDSRYAVYLDIYLPFQSDLKTCGLPTVTPSLYLASLNRFFQLVEKKYDIRVVVAAHPKAAYSGPMFDGREIIYGKTPDLVKNADFVIAEVSTAISYAVLGYKPIYFIYNNEIDLIYKNTVAREIKALSSDLGSAIYNIDNIETHNQIELREVNKELYDRYKYLYITSIESEDKYSGEIFYSSIMNLFSASGAREHQ